MPYHKSLNQSYLIGIPNLIYPQKVGVHLDRPLAEVFNTLSFSLNNSGQKLITFDLQNYFCQRSNQPLTISKELFFLSG